MTNQVPSDNRTFFDIETDSITIGDPYPPNWVSKFADMSATHQLIRNHKQEYDELFAKHYDQNIEMSDRRVLATIENNERKL